MGKVEAMFKNNRHMQAYAMFLLTLLDQRSDLDDIQETIIEEMDEQAQWDVIAFYSDVSKPKSFLRCSREFAKDMLALLKETYKIESAKRKED